MLVDFIVYFCNSFEVFLIARDVYVIPLNSLSALSSVNFFPTKIEIVYKNAKAKIHGISNKYNISKHVRPSPGNQLIKTRVPRYMTAINYHLSNEKLN